jgi:hypothetical protein
MKYLLIIHILFFTIPLLAQENTQNFILDERRQELLSIDTQFSKLSEAREVNEAFLSYLADDGVLLLPDNFPIVGKKISKERFFSRPD